MTAIIFDLDGTLIHSTPDLQEAVNRMLAEESLQPLDEATIESFVGNGLHKLVERVIECVDLEPRRLGELSARVLAHYNAVNGQKTVLYPGAADCLATLSANGYRLGICTNKPESPARKVLEHFELADLFPVIVGGDTLAVRKPDPELLCHCADQLGATRAEVVYVGDSEVDEATARNAGVPFALYTKGYRKKPAGDFESVLAFDDFAELAAWLGQRA